jgi:formylglycine-generating enzyme required for sulfatase activity
MRSAADVRRSLGDDTMAGTNTSLTDAVSTLITIGQSPFSDVFLSHNTADKPVVEELARQLLNAGITPWLDMWNLIPGEPWQEAIEEALDRCTCCAVFVGPGGAGPWQNEEMRAAIDRRVRDTTGKFRVIPVYLPGAPRKSDRQLPVFLRRQTWVDFQAGAADEEALRRLVCGIQGKAPGPARLAPQQGECPYRGLQSFDIGDSRLFFGREALTTRLVTRLCPNQGSMQRLRFLGILGPSGSGKSSLARAGLVASIQNGAIEGSQRWTTLVFRPGADPIESLAIALSSIYKPLSELSALLNFTRSCLEDERALHLVSRLILRDREADSHILLVVDQFEEVFSLCNDSAVVKAFVDCLIYASGVIGGRIITCVVMRADFYGKCAAHSSLATALSNNQILVDSMSAIEMRNAIEEPARLTGCRFEPGLVDVLLEDSIKETTTLPLLQHVLLELWEHRRGNNLTHEAYKQIGGLDGALERRAEEIFNRLAPSEQSQAKRLLLRMIEPGHGTEATKRRTPLAELTTISPSSSINATILSLFTAQDVRLVTTQAEDPIGGEATVELSHEALIKKWKRLRDWIEEDRQNLVVQRRLSEAAQEWSASDKNDAYLYRGPLLSRANEWAELYPDEITADEQEFLLQSRDLSAEQSRMSDAAALDQMEALAGRIWLSDHQMQQFVVRGQLLSSRIEMHLRQLERYRRESHRNLEGVWRFESEDIQFEHDTLELHVARLTRFRNSLLAAAEHVVAQFEAGRNPMSKERQVLWAEAIESIGRSEKYDGLQMSRQEGLLPIGEDPKSGLWEFALEVSGNIPRRGPDGLLALEDMSALILILVPGGTFRMGAVRPSASFPMGSPNVDPHSLEDEGPVHAVTLKPFFISKFQMTQGQWIRVTGTNPSMFRPDNQSGITLLHPVECVSWNDCTSVLPRVGLSLPTEEQWEYAARAGTTSIWFTGDDPEILKGNANLNMAGHTSVGTFDLPNRFGLFDVVGNVWEWCLDPFVDYGAGDSSLAANRESEDDFMPGSRGGSFFNDAMFARSSIRYFRTVPAARFNNRGLRPVRHLN